MVKPELSGSGLSGDESLIFRFLLDFLASLFNILTHASDCVAAGEENRESKNEPNSETFHGPNLPFSA